MMSELPFKISRPPEFSFYARRRTMNLSESPGDEKFSDRPGAAVSIRTGAAVSIRIACLN